MLRHSVRFALAAVPALFMAATADARRIPWKEFPVLKGTPYRTTIYRFKAVRSGPSVLLFAPHGDERSAGFTLYQYLRYHRPDRGTLFLCPFPVPAAWHANRRYWLEDLNRQFGSDSPDGTPVDIVALEVQALVKRHRIGYLLNVHEGWNFFRLAWKDYGQSVVVDTPEMAVKAGRVVRAINRRIRIAAHRFHPTLKPMPGTLTFWAQEAGVEAYGVEISRNLPWNYRLAYQRIAISTFLATFGIRLVPNR